MQNEYIEVKVGEETLRFPSTMTKAEIKTAIDTRLGVAKKEPAKTEEQPEESWFEDTVNLARMTIDGFTLGAQADMVGAIAGLGGYLTGKNDSISDGYKKARQMFLDENKEIQEDLGGYATAAQVAGSLAFPIKGAKTVVGTVAQGTGLAAVTGFMTADNDERMAKTGEAATFGGLLSLATAGLTKGAGKLWNGATRRRVQEDLVQPDGSFKPITLADQGKDAPIKSLYRDLFSKSFIGGRAFRESERKYLSAQEEVVDLAQRSYDDAKKHAQKSFKIENYADDTSLTALRREQNEIIKGLKNQKEELRGSLNVEIERVKSRVEAAKINKIDQAVDELDRSFRRRAFSESMPSNVTPAQIDNVLDSDDLLASTNILDELWKDSFDYIRNRSFKFNQKGIEDKMLLSLKDDIGTKYNRADIERMASSILSDMVSNKTKSGALSGDILANLRASLGRKAGELADTPEGRLRSELLRSLQKIIDDDIITPTLAKAKDKTALKKFAQDKKAYATATVLRDAVTQAARDPMRQGGFNAKEWLSAVSRNSKVQARRGTGTLQREANEWATATASRDARIKKAAVKIQQRHIQAAEKDAQQRIAQLEAEIAASKEKVASATQSKVTSKFERSIADASEGVQSAETKLMQEREILEQLKSAAGGAREPSFLTQLAANAVMAGPLGLATGIIGAPVAGAAVGKALTSQTGQRLMAGQTGAQAAGAQFGELVGDPLQQALRQAAVRVGGTQAARD